MRRHLFCFSYDVSTDVKQSVTKANPMKSSLIIDDFAPNDDVMEIGADEIVESFGHFISELIDAEVPLTPTNRSYHKAVEQFRRECGTDFVLTVIDTNETALFKLYNEKVNAGEV